MDLPSLYSDTGPERCGFVVNGEYIEVDNICPTPEQGFQMRAEDIIKWHPVAQATWHTHPGVPANLSMDDYSTFLNWPSLLHQVIGNDGMRCFTVTKGSVIEA